MRYIQGAICSHLMFDPDKRAAKLQAKYIAFERRASRDSMLLMGSDEGHLVRSYRELFEKTATLAYENSRLVLVYRGQPEDYRVPDKSKRSSLLPAIFRDHWKSFIVNKGNRKEFFDRLTELASRMRPEVFPQPPASNSEGDTELGNEIPVHSKRYNEQMWAIIQHYELWPTPMIDVTQSLQVACSFALKNPRKDHGFVYVLGLPGIGGSVSYSVDDEMCVARLQTVCPPKAIRAHFQEGLLVSDFPLVRRRPYATNLANRLVGKFKISRDGFWSDGFRPLDSKTLLPEEDPFAAELKAIQERVFPKLYDGLSSESQPAFSAV
jgi:hypothetical protein